MSLRIDLVILVLDEAYLLILLTLYDNRIIYIICIANGNYSNILSMFKFLSKIKQPYTY